jgi:mycofactocin precursor
MSNSEIATPNTQRGPAENEDDVIQSESLVEEVSIDGMCGVY